MTPNRDVLRRRKSEPQFEMVWERPSAYRYLVAHPGLKLALNRYPGAVIGIALIAGRYAYCLKWGRPGSEKP
jgi:hypothetical protein